MQDDFARYADEIRRGLTADEEKPTLQTVSAVELYQKDIPPLKWVVDRLMSAGLVLIASPPKYGKSWLMLALCLCVASGWKFLGYRTYKCDVLYLALEDGERRLKSRMTKLLNGAKPPEGFYFSTGAADLDHGLFDQLDGFLAEHPGTGLIVIDTLQKVRGSVRSKEGAYAADYREVGAIKSYADQHGLCVVLVHHLRKMSDDTDPFNRISGTTGISGAADAMIVLSREKREDSTTTMHIEGRDVESADLVLSFDREKCVWHNMGDADAYAEEQARAEYASSPVVVTIKKLLEQSPTREWSGTSKDLLDAGRYIVRKQLAPSPRELSDKLKALDNLLLEYEGIAHERTKNGSGGGKHKFHYMDVPQLEEYKVIPF